jgi:sulfopyruvate decarboxylase TPP-binding subunit
MNTVPPAAGSTSSAASGFVDALVGEGVTHVVTVPDNTSAALLREFRARANALGKEPHPASEPPPVETLFATREGEAMGLAAGLWMGGAEPVLLIQNTGLMEAGDGLRGVVARMGLPVVLLVTCRGYPKARKAGMDPRDVSNPAARVIDKDILVRSDLDSVAHMTEGTLKAWGIPFSYLDDPGDLAPLGAAFADARKEGRPVALLIDTTFEPGD